jgi:hypothetical protein
MRGVKAASEETGPMLGPELVGATAAGAAGTMAAGAEGATIAGAEGAIIY